MSRSRPLPPGGPGGRNVLITGGAGFIGANLADHLAAAGHGDPPEPDAAGSRFAWHRAVAAYLTAAAHRRPLLLVLDDLHWAGPETLSLLARRRSSAAATSGVRRVAPIRTRAPSGVQRISHVCPMSPRRTW